MDLCSPIWELRIDILCVQNGGCMNEISILKNECLEWKNWKTSKIMGLSHIGGGKKWEGFITNGLQEAYKLLCIVILQLLPARRGGADCGFRKPKSSNLHVSATCGHECSSKFSSPRNSVLPIFLFQPDLNFVTEDIKTEINSCQLRICFHSVLIL